MWLIDPKSKHSSVNKVQSVQLVYTKFGLPADAAALMTWLVDPRSKQSSVNKVQSVQFVYTEFGLPADAAASMMWLVDPRSKHFAGVSPKVVASASSHSEVTVRREAACVSV